MGTSLKAGTASITITPDRLLYLQGYGARTHAATGTLDPLEARAIAFDDGSTRAAIVSADLLGLDASSVGRVRAAAEAASGIPGDNIMVSCSHTHSGPAVQQFCDDPVDAEYLSWLERSLGEAVAAAAESMQPVTLAVGEGAADFNVNRRMRRRDGSVGGPNPTGPVERRVRVLRFDPADAPKSPGTLGGARLPQSEPIAVLFSYVCHPTSLMSQSYRYSADYPGAARRFVEGAYRGQGDGETMAMFLPGCFGDVRPHLLDHGGAFRAATDHELEVLGRLLGAEVIRVAERLVGEDVEDIGLTRREVSLPYSHVPDLAELQASLEDERPNWWAQRLLGRLEREGSLPKEETGEVAALRLGRHWILTTPGETMLEIGWSIERGLVELGLAQPERGDLTLALGYTNGNLGYLCTAGSILEGGYEPATAYNGYLRPGPFAPIVEHTLIQTALDMALQIQPS